MSLNIYVGNKSVGYQYFIMCFVCVCLSVCRTESVAEKMLTNWFTFLLYKFLKVTRPVVCVLQFFVFFYKWIHKKYMYFYLCICQY